MKSLIVTADDLAFDRDTNAAIVAAVRDGIVTQASVMGNGTALEDAAASFATVAPVGVHLNMTELSAVTAAVRGVSAADGSFLGPGKVLLACGRGAVDRDAVRREWDEQIARVRGAGFHPTYLDGHHHAHVFPGMFSMTLDLARRHGIAAVRVPRESPLLPHPGARLKRALLAFLSRGKRQAARDAQVATADHFRGLTLFCRESDHHSRLLSLLEELPAGRTELMVHPRPGPLGKVEAASLTHPRTREILDRLGVTLTTSVSLRPDS